MFYGLLVGRRGTDRIHTEKERRKIIQESEVPSTSLYSWVSMYEAPTIVVARRRGKPNNNEKSTIDVDDHIINPVF